MGFCPTESGPRLRLQPYNDNAAVQPGFPPRIRAAAVGSPAEVAYLFRKELPSSVWGYVIASGDLSKAVK